jgi:3-hydroxyacyl-[acyl-carrier-protein] dehydratase
MRWLWIDCITEHEPDHRLVATKKIDCKEDRLHQFTNDGLTIMPFSLLIEGMAQTAGILVGSTTGFKEKVILAKIAKATLDRDVTDGDTVRFDATIERVGNAGASTIGTIDRCKEGGDAWERIGTVELMFSHIDNNLAGTEFPEHNFVFSDNFRTILETAGLADLIEE